MALRVAINGFGRIGRLISATSSRTQFRDRGDHDITDATTLATCSASTRVRPLRPARQGRGDVIDVDGRG